MADRIDLLKARQVCAGWKSAAAYSVSTALRDSGSRHWLAFRATAVVTHDRALREFDALVDAHMGKESSKS